MGLKSPHGRSASILIVIVLLYVFYAFYTEKRNCHSSYDFVSDDLSDLTFDIQPVLGKSIFFHETSCSSLGSIQLSPRQGCAVESAALMNPNSDVFLIFTGSKLTKNEQDSEVLQVLSNYTNIQIRSLNLLTYSIGTPSHEWLKAKNILGSKYLTSHLSDFLRYLTLYKWGGTYLDLDVIVKHSIENMEPNYAGAESASFVASGVMNIDYKGVGHRIAAALLTNFINNFNGNNWGNNGPGVITRVLRNICRTTNPTRMKRERCNGFLVHPTNLFYAVPWYKWENFFNPLHLESVLNETANSMLVHVWNHHSKKHSTDPGLDVAYTVLAKKYCPRIYDARKNDFN